MPLYIIFNASLEQNIFPSYWKYANVIPIPRNNKDYRPISLLPFVSKVFEKDVLQFIIMPIADPYFKQNQLAFVPNHIGTTNALSFAFENYKGSHK